MKQTLFPRTLAGAFSVVLSLLTLGSTLVFLLALPGQAKSGWTEDAQLVALGLALAWVVAPAVITFLVAQSALTGRKRREESSLVRWIRTGGLVLAIMAIPLVLWLLRLTA